MVTFIIKQDFSKHLKSAGGGGYVNMIEPLVTLPSPLFMNVPVVRDTKEQKVRNDRRDFAAGRSA